MNVQPLAISDVKLIAPKRIEDSRGYFAEVFKADWFRSVVADVEFIQQNKSLSRRAGTLRGLHLQVSPFAQGKLLRCLQGAMFDVAVDLRHGSATYGRWLGTILSAENGHQLWIPEGFAHGFLTLSENTIIHYGVTSPYSPAHERGVRWDDPTIAVRWPIETQPLLSERDKVLPELAEVEL